MQQNFKLLYRTGKTEKEFSKLEWVDNSGREADFISPFFQEHLQNISPELRLFILEKNGQKSTKYWLKKIKKELDAIAWYPQGKFFIIFEYKSKEPHKKMEQIRGYLGTISDGENKDCIELVDNLNMHFPKEKGISWRYGEVNWEETRILWISPSLPSRKLSSENWCYENPKIIWIKSEWYGNKESKSETAVTLKNEGEENLLEQLSKEGKVRTPKLERKNLYQLLEEIKPSKEVEKWSRGIHKIAVEEFSLTLEIHPNPRWRWLFYKNYKKTLFWGFISKRFKRITIYFDNVDKNKFLVEKHALQETPTIFKWVVNNEEKFAKALLLLRDFWRQQIKV